MVQVIKANGQKEAFSEEKVMKSIYRAGIPKDLQEATLAHVKEKLYDDIPTHDIYHHISEFLGASASPFTRSKYSLKQSIMMLGPTGYPFEDFIEKLLIAKGYETKVRQILRGTCVSHEIDIITKKDGKTGMIEAKFHNNPGIRSDVHVALYTKARFDDVKTRYQLNNARLITNTKATSDAIAYGECVGMKVISWSYPENGSLRDWIEESHLHPITMLTSLSLSQKAQLLQNHIIMCKDIIKNPSTIDILYLDKAQRQRTLNEALFIAQGGQATA